MNPWEYPQENLYKQPEILLRREEEEDDDDEAGRESAVEVEEKSSATWVADSADWTGWKIVWVCLAVSPAKRFACVRGCIAAIASHN